MKNRELFENWIGEETGSINPNADEWLRNTVSVLTRLNDDLKKNQPQARVTINSLDVVIDELEAWASQLDEEVDVS